MGDDDWGKRAQRTKGTPVYTSHFETVRGGWRFPDGGRRRKKPVPFLLQQ
jgi:hypothetical protein